MPPVQSSVSKFKAGMVESVLDWLGLLERPREWVGLQVGPRDRVGNA